jgi:DNA anti-recombination protein RmuC
VQTVEQPRSSWSDDRLDHLESRMDKGFSRVDERFNHLESRMDARFHHFEGEINRRFEKVDARFNRFEGEVSQRLDRIDSTLHEIHRSMWVTLAGMFAALVGLIAVLQA